MNRLRFPLLAAIGLILPANLVWSAPLPAGRSGLDQIPATAPLVFHLRGVQGTRDRLVAMMENALPDVLKKFQTQMDESLKEGFDGRKIRGLRKDGPLFLIFTELPKAGAAFPDPPPLAVILAVSDYKEFQQNVLTEAERKTLKKDDNGIESVTFQNEAKPSYFLDRKGYAVITPDKNVAETFTKKFTGLDTKMSKDLAAKLLNADLGVFVNMDTVNKDYAEQIKEAKGGIEQLLALSAGAGDESQKKMVEMAKKAIGPIFQAVEDMQGFLATVEMRPGGLALHLQSEMKESSATANLLQDSRPIAFKDLERMPKGRAYYSAFKTSAALYKGLGSAMVGIPLGKGGDESKEVAAVLEELAKAGPIDRLDGYTFPMSGLSIYHYDDTAKAVAAQVKLFKAMAESDPKSVGLREKPVLKMDAQTYGDFKLHSVQLRLDFEKMAEPVAQRGDDTKKQYIEAMKQILGDKMTLWFGTDGKTVVQVSAANWEAAQKLLDQYSKGGGTIGEVKAFGDVRKEMPARTSFLSLIDAVHMFGVMLDAFRPFIPGGQLPPGWPNMPAKGAATGFVGLSVTLQPSRGSLDLFITAAAAQDFYKAVVKPLVGE
jgi:hypothetical protein